MATIHISKAVAAQRQLDAAIRILFAGEDSLAVHTLAAAAAGVLKGLAEHRKIPFFERLDRVAFDGVYQGLLGRSPNHSEIERDSPKLKKLMHSEGTRHANFLKHADRDPNDFLSEADLKTDHLLLQSCTLYGQLGHELTPAMWAFGRWHLAVYPSEDADTLETAAGPVHQLPREHQLAFGGWLLEQSTSSATT